MVTLFIIRDVLYRVAVLTAIQSTIQDVLRAPSLSASLHELSGNESYWRAIGLGSYLPAPPTLHLASLSTVWIRPGGRFIDCAVLGQIAYTAHEFNFTETLVTPPATFTPPITPTLPAFTCPPTSTPPPPPAPPSVTSTPVHPYESLIKFRRPVALVHHRVSNPLNPDDVFEFKILETVIDRYFIDLAWEPTAAVTDVSIGRVWSAVWIHMACTLVFWICTGTKRVRLALIDLLPDFVIPSVIESVTVGRATFEEEMASVAQDFVLELGLADLFLSICGSMLVETIVFEGIVSIEQLEPTEGSDEDDMAAIEELIQVAPLELSEEPVDSFLQGSEPATSIEELESDDEEMAAVEGLIQVVSDEPSDEPELFEESTSTERLELSDEIVAVEDMTHVPAATESTTIEESTRAETLAIEDFLVTATPEVVVLEELGEERPVKEFAPVRPSLNKDAPAFVPRFVRSAFAELPTAEEVNDTLDELLSRLETGVGAKFSGPRDTPPALVQPSLVPVVTPIANPKSSTPVPPAAPEPRRIRTFYAERPPRPPRRK